MASTINATTASGGGVITTADASGVLQLQSNGTTIATISSTGLSTQVGSPTFSAYAGSSQSFSAGVWTKVQINTEEWDTNSNFDTSTYRFTPTVAGYYQVNGRITADTKPTTLVVSIYKNGSSWKRGNAIASNAGEAVSGSSLVYMNGSTDYIELYAYFSNTYNDFVASDQTYFQASLARSA